MSEAIVFTLEPADSEIPDLIHQYHEDLDSDCFAAGTRIRNGDLSKENLRVIYRWKMQSRRYLGQEQKYFDKNSDEAVANVLRATINAVDRHRDTERAFRELQSLKGIGLPVASAILTAVFPDRFTVIDIMAFRALGVPEETPLSIPLYLRYLAYCGQQAERLAISLRDMDRAIWQWGHDHPSKKAQKSN
jgi:hypothetical protein